MKQITIILIALSLFSCKARKVALSKVDSTTNTKTESQVKKETSSIDTGKIDIHTEVMSVDSSQYEVSIETGGKIINVVDGNYSGPADKVIIKGKKQSQTKTTEHKQEIKGLTTQAILDSTGTAETKTTTHKKTKDTEAKPDYSWIVWLVGIIGVLFLSLFIYNKIKPV